MVGLWGVVKELVMAVGGWLVKMGVQGPMRLVAVERIWRADWPPCQETVTLVDVVWIPVMRRAEAAESGSVSADLLLEVGHAIAVVIGVGGGSKGIAEMRLFPGVAEAISHRSQGREVRSGKIRTL